MYDLEEFKRKRKDLKIRLKAAQREVEEIKEELELLRQHEQHRAVDNLEYWLEEEDAHHATVFEGIRQILHPDDKKNKKEEK